MGGRDQSQQGSHGGQVGLPVAIGQEPIVAVGKSPRSGFVHPYEIAAQLVVSILEVIHNFGVLAGLLS